MLRANMSRPAEEPRRAAPADPGSTLELSEHDLEAALVAADEVDDSDTVDTEVFGADARAAVARAPEPLELSSSELVDVDGTARLPALAATGASETLAVFDELRPAGRPTMPSIHPSSIAPVALDAARAPAVSLPPPAAPASRASWVVGAIAAAAAVALLGVAGAGVVVAKGSAEPPRTLAVPTLEMAPRAAAEAEVGEEDDGAIRQAVATAKERSPALDETEVEAPKDAPAPARPRTGTLRFAPGTRDLLVDGAPQATASGQVTVACGKHWVKVGAAFGRAIDVPCGGAASVQ